MVKKLDTQKAINNCNVAKEARPFSPAIIFILRLKIWVMLLKLK